MLMMCVWMVMCVYIYGEYRCSYACVYGEDNDMFMCVWIGLSLVFVCEQVAICFANMLIHFHFVKTLAFRKGPNFRIGHAEIFYRPLHACIHYVVLIDFKIVPCTSCRQNGPHNERRHCG